MTLTYLDLYAESGDHERKWAAVDDEAKSADHQPGEDEPDHVILPPKNMTP